MYRGDCARDENGVAAVYEELGANPTSAQGLNACLAYGSLPGHSCTAADAVKAYVRAFLKSKYKTWIELPPELRPEWWRGKFVRPVVLLLRALTIWTSRCRRDVGKPFKGDFEENERRGDS